MKIIHVVTLITPEGAYGGPVRVAVNQTRALRAAGHDVTLAAGASGFGPTLPTSFDGVPVKLFRARQIIPRIGFAGLAAPGLQQWLRRTASADDLLHIHMARDFITLPVALFARRKRMRYVVQTHGMIDPTSNPLAVPLDKFWTIPALSSADKVFFLTPQEKVGLGEVVGAPLDLSFLQNGVPLSSRNVDASNRQIEVLFLARLHERKRPLHFAHMARELHQEFPEVQFRVVGPDEGEGDKLQRVIKDYDMSTYLQWEGPLKPENTQARMAKASIYVLPSVDEPFPMSVLEAMALGLPTVITDSCGLAPVIGEERAGLVADDTIASLTASVRLLLTDTELRKSMGAKAAASVAARFSMNSIVKALEKSYALEK